MKFAFLLMFLIVGCMFSLSWAETTPNSSVDDTETPPEGQDTAGDPVGVIDGNVLDAVVDLRVECPGIDLVFKAHTADGPRTLRKHKYAGYIIRQIMLTNVTISTRYCGLVTKFAYILGDG